MRPTIAATPEELLKSVLSGYSAASEMPKSITQVPGFRACLDAPSRDRFESEYLNQEATKWYKAIQGARVFLIRNPMIWHLEQVNGGLYDKQFRKIRTAPRFMGTVSELQKQERTHGDIEMLSLEKVRKDFL